MNRNNKIGRLSRAEWEGEKNYESTVSTVCKLTDNRANVICEISSIEMKTAIYLHQKEALLFCGSMSVLTRYEPIILICLEIS